jgi:hypothetical protein
VTHTTVVRDLKRIKEAWINEYAADINTHKAHLRAEHREVRRRLWNAPTPDYALILRSLEGEAKLYDAPAGPAAAPDVELQLSELGLDPAEVLQQVEAMLAGAP